MLTGRHQALPNYTRLPVRPHIIVSYGNNSCFVAEVSKEKLITVTESAAKTKRFGFETKDKSLRFPLARAAGESLDGRTDCLMGLESEEFGRWQ